MIQAVHYETELGADTHQTRARWTLAVMQVHTVNVRA